MRTDDLIKAMVADQHGGRNIDDTLRLALLSGAALAGLAFFIMIGFRADIAEAAQTVRFLFKFVVTLSLTTVAVALVFRIGRPGVPLAVPAWSLAGVPLLLIGAVAVELAATPSDAWSSRLIGTNALHCLAVIPLLSLPPLIGLLIALRKGAPAHPGITGAVAGLVSVGIAATYYASNCTDDSPLFVATWYPLAAAIVVAIGAVVGSRLLRW
jgi:hypothetical protein